jgi:hypothetical protein
MARRAKLKGTVERRTNKDGSESFRARVPTAAGRVTSKWTADEAVAVQARIDLNQNGARTGDAAPLGEKWAEWLRLAEEGVERTRSGSRYKPSVLRSYGDSMRLHVAPVIGGTARRGDQRPAADAPRGPAQAPGHGREHDPQRADPGPLCDRTLRARGRVGRQMAPSACASRP